MRTTISSCCIVLFILVIALAISACSFKGSLVDDKEDFSTNSEQTDPQLPLSEYKVTISPEISLQQEIDSVNGIDAFTGVYAELEGFTSSDQLLTTDVSGNIVSVDPTTRVFYCDGSGTSCTQPYASSSLKVGSNSKNYSISTDSSGITISSGLALSGNLTLPSSAVTSYTPTVTYGTSLKTSGTSPYGYYVSLGSIKMCWGIVPMIWSVTSTTYTSGTTYVTLPTGMFSTITNYQCSVTSVGNNANQFVNGDGFSTSQIKFYLYAYGGVGQVSSATYSVDVHFLVIGT